MQHRGGNERERKRGNKYTGFMQEAMRPALSGREEVRVRTLPGKLRPLLS